MTVQVSLPSMARSAPPDAQHVQRRDIEGLRAVAVVLVVASHLGGWPLGGFVGVDVFFVVSGYLITGLLVREVEKSGRVSFREFYARRVRRILPVALLVLAVTCLSARLLFFDARARQTYVDALWAAFSLENWHLADVGTDYFASTLPPSPVQQYWSLSVEEQFYLAWPVLIVATAIAVRRWSLRELRPVLGVVLGVVVLLSFTWALQESSVATTVAYFSTFTRAWELGIGGLLALVTRRLVAMPRWLSGCLSWGGLAAIVIAAQLTRADEGFPAPGAIPAVLGTAALIAGGCAGKAPPIPVLANPMSRYLGRISYSVYLWHWPIIIFAESLWADLSSGIVAGILVVTVGLSMVTYHFVEEPVRRTSWLSRRDPERPPRRLAGSARALYSATIIATAVLAALFSLMPPVPVEAPSATAGPASARPGGSERTDVDDDVAAWKSKIEKAVVATEWPELQPSLDDLVTARAAEWDSCGNVDRDEALEKCRFGTSTKTSKKMVVVGDSIAISWLPTLRAGFEHRGWVIQGLTYGECPPARIDVESSSKDQGFTAKCAAHQRFALDRAVDLKPDLIVLSDTDATVGRVLGGGAPRDAMSRWGNAQAVALKKLSQAKRPIVVLSSPPPRKDLVSCATRLGSPADCLSTIGRTWTSVRDMERSVAERAGATFIDTSSMTCDSQSYCPAFIGTTPVMADGVHLTDALARELGPMLYEQIADQSR